MKTLLLCTLLLVSPGGDREKGLQLYREGRFAEAAAAFRAAIAHDGDSAELQWNLALASWRAGDLAAAETAAEKYAAMAGDARPELHRGVMGAVRHDEAKALEAKADALLGAAGAMPPAAADPNAEPTDPLALLEQALQKATQARDHFVGGAMAKPTPELLRNTERTLRYIESLQKKIEDEKKKREEQQQDEKNKDEKNKDEQKQDQKGEGEQRPKDEPQKDPAKPEGEPPQGQEGADKPEPKPGESKPQESQPDQGKPEEGQPGEPKPQQGKAGDEKGDAADGKPAPAPEPKPGEGKPRGDAPGEVADGKELTPEQAQRLLEQVKDLDQKLKSIRARARSGRPPVERDW